MMVIHLLGDIHQPMHIGHASDLGGNRWTVNYFGRDTNLHSVWDHSLPESAHKWSYTEWQREVDRATPQEVETILNGGKPRIMGKKKPLTFAQTFMIPHRKEPKSVMTTLLNGLLL